MRDVYQRFIHADATDREIRWLTYGVIISVGAIAVAANLRPPKYLQALVVFSGTGQAAAFVTPILMVAFWRRATVPGVMAAMLTGAGTVLGLLRWAGLATIR